jgi:nitrite reductase/ring-hydroxylating ferredoxin subunit
MSQDISQKSWITVGLSAGLDAGRVMPVKLPHQDLAIWRQRSGQVNAVEDRCPHRGMRFSLGFVRGDRLACRYHGWEYDGTGACKNIPAHPSMDPPKTICAKTFDCQEDKGFIRICLDQDGVDSGNELAMLADDTLLPVRSIYVDAGMATVADWLMATGFPAFAPGDVAVRYEHDRPASDLVRITARLGDTQEVLLIALQMIDDHTTGLHVQAMHIGSKDNAADVKLHVSAWLTNLRWCLEDQYQKIPA